MANYILTYDLNGPVPTHAQIDKHIRNCGTLNGRLLETVWFVQSPATIAQVYEYVNRILSTNDRVLVVEASDAYFRNLLVSNADLQSSWKKAA